MSSIFQESSAPTEAWFQALLARLAGFPDEFAELTGGIEKAIAIADRDPEMALTRIRKVLEFVVREVYERRCQKPAGTQPLENLLDRISKDGFFPPVLEAYATTVRKLGNVGTHRFGETITVDEVHRSLAQLRPVIDWYTEVERIDAVSGKPPIPPPIPAKAQRPAAPQPQIRMAIIPKGLRSFDAGDVPFFLRLLPGPFDRDGLPESIRFWKHRIETTEELTFTVGVIYGPSGCGKSSLVKAGLLPRLAEQVLSVYVEASADDTEVRLLKGLRKRCPDLPQNLELTESIAALWQGRGLAPGQKVLIVLDQFEQWLHAMRGQHDTELARALQQCDGERVQAVVTVRDDFWLAISRFMRELNIELRQGENSALVDLFDPIHARSVLSAFGAAFGRLTDVHTAEQELFLDQAVQGLAQDGKVISVRLSLFAEMVKGKPWTPTTLKEVGGAEGIGVTFLEETFSAPSANRKYRSHQQGATAILKALLPEHGSDIKGQMRPLPELMIAAGYQDRNQDFAELLRILDGELRLITPADQQVAAAKIAHAAAPAADSGHYYQLAHDYLVPALREWLTRKQRETGRGRAELRLEERAALWSIKPENRFLPSVLEYVRIQLLTRRRDWTAGQSHMMRRAGRVYALRGSMLLLLGIVLGFSGVTLRNRLAEQQYAQQAEGLVNGLLKADIAQVPDMVQELASYRPWADPLLRQACRDHLPHSAERLHAALALLPVDAGQVDYLRERLLASDPMSFPTLRDALLGHRDRLNELLWGVLEDRAAPAAERFQAACALATYAQNDSGEFETRWQKLGSWIADRMVATLIQNPSNYAAVVDALRPARREMLKPLAAIFRAADRGESERTLATSILVAYASDQSELLTDLLMDADEQQFALLYPAVQPYGQRAIDALSAVLGKSLLSDQTDPGNESLARRQANAAAALLRLGQAEKVWPLLKHAPDPRVRSYVIDRLSPLGSDPKIVIGRLREEREVSIRRALLLILGEFNAAQLPNAEREPVITTVLQMYRDDPDPGVHGASAWLMAQWNQRHRLAEIDAALATGKVEGNRNWYINGQGQTMAVVAGPVEFVKGSPPGEEGRAGGRDGKTEVQHLTRIGRSFAIAATEATVEQFLRFRNDHSFNKQYAPQGDCPVNGVSWYGATAYCNWLSRQEGIAKDQWCYLANEKGEFAEGMKLAPDYLHRTGYRLPSEAEWEFSCRAGAVTSRFFGETEELLGKYAWYIRDSKRRWMLPVGSLRPNDLGLFDMLGNAWERCQERYVEQAKGSDDQEDEANPKDNDLRVIRGGSLYRASSLRGADRETDPPQNSHNYIGFRVARTVR
jgi:formylglycine-generating enzyme required for sulfatase activity